MPRRIGSARNTSRLAGGRVSISIAPMIGLGFTLDSRSVWVSTETVGVSWDPSPRPF